MLCWYYFVYVQQWCYDDGVKSGVMSNDGASLKIQYMEQSSFHSLLSLSPFSSFSLSFISLEETPYRGETSYMCSPTSTTGDHMTPRAKSVPANTPLQQQVTYSIWSLGGDGGERRKWGFGLVPDLYYITYCSPISHSPSRQT